MYEDLTNLTVVKVELLNGQFGAETQWNCVYTADQRSACACVCSALPSGETEN